MKAFRPVRSFGIRWNRRRVVQGVLGLGIAGGLVSPDAWMADADAAEIARQRPQDGDQLTYFGGDRDGEVIAPADLSLGEQPFIAYPRDPSSGVIRDGSRLNQITLLRVDPSRFDDRTRPGTVDGIIAFSATCTHQQCPVTAWDEQAEALFCFCHRSRFDPWNAGKVVNGPATRKLPTLPLRLEGDNELRIAGGFSGRVGN